MRRNIILQRKKVKVLLDAAKVIVVIPGRCGTHRTRNPEAACIGFAVSPWIPDRASQVGLARLGHLTLPISGKPEIGGRPE